MFCLISKSNELVLSLELEQRLPDVRFTQMHKLVQGKLDITNTAITRYRLLRGNFRGPNFPSTQVYVKRYSYSEIGCYEITAITR